jgi:hypothetical protein
MGFVKEEWVGESSIILPTRIGNRVRVRVMLGLAVVMEVKLKM